MWLILMKTSVIRNCFWISPDVGLSRDFKTVTTGMLQVKMAEKKSMTLKTDTWVGIIQFEEQRDKRSKKIEQSLIDQLTNISGVPEGEERAEKNMF